MLTLALAAAPLAVASPCGSNTNPHEMFFENFGGWSLNVYDGNGNLVPATFWDGNGNQLPNEDWPYLIPGRSDCDLVIENNGHNGHQHIKLDVDGVAIFELSPAAGGSGTGDDAGYLMFAYGIGSSDTFYEPNGSYGTTVNGDVFVLREELALRFSLSWMWSSPSGIRYVDEFFPDDTWVMPYEADVVCVGMGGSPSTCDLRYEEGQFITLQTNWPAAEYQNPTYRFSGLTDIERHENIVENWNTTAMTLEFPQDTRFIANGRFGAEGVTFTEAASGQGWGGILVRGDDGRLSFDGVIVEHAEVGITVASGNGAIHTNTIRNTLLTDNGIGLLADTHANGFGLARSSFILRESCVVNSEFNQALGFEGHGIWGRWTDAFIVNTTVEGNDGYGVSFENADLNIAHGLLVTGNGAGSPSFNDGVHSGSNGDVTLASPFGGSGYDVGPGRNSIHDNEQDQISIAPTGFATVGAGCGPTVCPEGNSVYGPFAQNGSYLIDNRPSSTIPAERVFWGQNHQNPPAPDDDAFSQPALVDDANPLSSDPASDAGRTLGCAPSTFLGGGGGLGRSASASSRAVQAFGGGSSGEGRELGPETAAWLRGRIRAMRAALAENPAADTSAALLGRLYGLQRLDRTDALGEHGATMGLLASLRARLMGEGSLPPALRATAEAALVAGVHDLMRGEDYEAARTVVAALAPRAEAGRTRLAMALAEAALDEVDGDYASAIGKYEGIIEALGPEHDQLARDLAATVALLEGRLGEGQRLGDPAGEAPAAQVAAEAGRAEATSTFGLGSVYPNPFNPTTIIPFALDASADVRLAVYDVLGRRVALLADGRFEAGSHTLRFDASALPSGTYLVRMTATPESGAARTFTRRITLLR